MRPSLVALLWAAVPRHGLICCAQQHQIRTARYLRLLHSDLSNITLVAVDECEEDLAVFLKFQRQSELPQLPVAQVHERAESRPTTVSP